MSNIVNNIVSLELRALRKERKLTQPELSRLSGIPQNQISSMETASRSPSFQNICKLCNAMNISCDEFWRRCKIKVDLGGEEAKEEQAEGG